MPKQSSKRTPLKTAAFDDQPLNGAESLCVGLQKLVSLLLISQIGCCTCTKAAQGACAERKCVQAFSPSTLDLIWLNNKKECTLSPQQSVAVATSSYLPTNRNWCVLPPHTCTWCPVTPLTTVLFSMLGIYAEAHSIFSPYLFYVVNTFPSMMNDVSLYVQVV